MTEKIKPDKRARWKQELGIRQAHVQDRHLIINENEAQVVRHVFHRYLAVRSVSALVKEIRQTGLRTKVYTSRAGRTSGGRPFSRGHLYHLLHNRIYRGDIVHHQETYPGNHPAIIAKDVWEQTQQVLQSNRRAWQRDTRLRTPFLLQGLLFDMHGHRFSPVQARKGSRTYRYYINQMVIQCQDDPDVNFPRRMPAASLEQTVMQAVRDVLRKEEETKLGVKSGEELNQQDQQEWWR